MGVDLLSVIQSEVNQKNKNISSHHMQAHEKMLNMAEYQSNANQNYSEISPHTSQNGQHQKVYNNKCSRGCGEKGTLLYCWWECKLVQPLWRTVCRFLKKTGNRTASWSSNPTTGHTHWGNQNWKRHMYPNVQHSTVYNSQDMEVT